MAEKCPDLDAAYALDGPEASRRLYRDWSQSYDDDFARARGYRLPRAVAGALLRAGGTAGPVLDVGAGTGLVAAALAEAGVGPIDALDLSPEMLEVARRKGLYRALFCMDVTAAGMAIAEGTYAGIVSAGTFTHGHVGPEGIRALLPLAAPGGIFALSINAGVYRSEGFADCLAALSSRITRPRAVPTPIYGPASGTAGADAHAGDTALVVTFRKRRGA